MKKLISILMLLMAFTMSSNAMSYEQARQQALFLTDKMAYELNLTNDQYEAAYEINLDYLMSVNTVDDLYGAYWRYRNLDMSYVLLDWQYRAFCDAAYFYRPLYFNAGYWHFGIYARYPHRDYFYFNRPTVYVSYCGGHSWGMNRGVLGIMDVTMVRVVATTTLECATDLTVVTMDVATDSRSVHAIRNL